MDYLITADRLDLDVPSKQADYTRALTRWAYENRPTGLKNIRINTAQKVEVTLDASAPQPILAPFETHIQTVVKVVWDGSQYAYEFLP